MWPRRAVTRLVILRLIERCGRLKQLASGRCTSPLILDSLAAKNVESHFRATSCGTMMRRRAVQQFPSEADFVSNFNLVEAFGWGGRDRTSAWGNQNPLPYRLATPQQAGRGAAVVAAESLSGGGLSTERRGGVQPPPPVISYHCDPRKNGLAGGTRKTPQSVSDRR